MPPYLTVLIGLLLLLLFPLGGLYFLAQQSARTEPESIGREHLAEGPRKPNWVSSMTLEKGHRIEPIGFSGRPEMAWEKIQQAVSELGKSAAITAEKDYLHVECRTPLLGFVDDLELLLNAEEQRIEVRSASRAGHSDLGANRKRVEKLRTLFEAKTASIPKS